MIDGRFRFEAFVTGPSNRLAAAAARAVAEAPGRTYHPLFLYAEAGLGKSHLLGAIGFHAARLAPGLTVACLPARELAEQLASATARGALNAWRREWEGIGLLLLDDLQVLEGHHDAQAELLRLLDHAQGSGRQLVLASDRPPADLDGFDQRLVARLAGGLVADIAPPELETRLGILRRWCADRGVALDEAGLAAFAAPEVASVGELLGRFNRLAAPEASTPAAPAAGTSAVASPPREAPAAVPDEFESFLHEVAAVVSSSVERWRVRLAATVARWAGEGYRTALLERHLDGVEAPDVDAIEDAFSSAVNQLRDLEQEAARLDPKLAGVPVFRDPERVAEARAIVLRALAAYDPPPAAAPHLTIATFTPGARNQMALRAAGEVIALPGTRFNPLFIHGLPGSGRTHLVHAIANALRGRDGGSWTVAVVDAAALHDELAEAMRTATLERWRSRYRAADALVIDNVQRVGGHERLEDEVFHLANDFLGAGRQVVLTADESPQRLAAVAPRLRSLFESGLVVEIGRVSEAEAIARHTPVPDGDEAAAPTIDAWFDDMAEEGPDRSPSIPVTSSVDSFFLDPEKVITEWPSLDGRVVEDPR